MDQAADLLPLLLTPLPSTTRLLLPAAPGDLQAPSQSSSFVRPPKLKSATAAAALPAALDLLLPRAVPTVPPVPFLPLPAVARAVARARLRHLVAPPFQVDAAWRTPDKSN